MKMFEAAPQLEKVHANSIGKMAATFRFHWSSLTHYRWESCRFQCSVEALQVLQLCPNLTHAAISSDHPYTHGGRPVTLSRLCDLQVTIHGNGSLSGLLSNLRLLALKTLALMPREWNRSEYACLEHLGARSKFGLESLHPQLSVTKFQLSHCLIDVIVAWLDCDINVQSNKPTIMPKSDSPA
ncbi:hypothetical protein C8J56DRAFT_959046 [Mycena floridula]|nr:hypothetical protein C8J56DRAFT_959046 [Mycena floridula]